MFSWVMKKIRGDDDENHEYKRKNSMSGRRKSTNEGKEEKEEGRKKEGKDGNSTEVDETWRDKNKKN